LASLSDVPETLKPPLLPPELLELLPLIVTEKFWVLLVPHVFVYVAVAVPEVVGYIVCSREVPEVPSPLQLHEPPLAGCGPNLTVPPDATVALAVCVQVPPLTCM
jgi:hypothetical protein